MEHLTKHLTKLKIQLDLVKNASLKIVSFQ